MRAFFRWRLHALCAGFFAIWLFPLTPRQATTLAANPCQSACPGYVPTGGVLRMAAAGDSDFSGPLLLRPVPDNNTLSQPDKTVVDPAALPEARELLSGNGCNGAVMIPPPPLQNPLNSQARSEDVPSVVEGNFCPLPSAQSAATPEPCSDSASKCESAEPAADFCPLPTPCPAPSTTIRISPDCTPQPMIAPSFHTPEGFHSTPLLEATTASPFPTVNPDIVHSGTVSAPPSYSRVLPVPAWAPPRDNRPYGGSRPVW